MKIKKKKNTRESEKKCMNKASEYWFWKKINLFIHRNPESIDGIELI